MLSKRFLQTFGLFLGFLSPLYGQTWTKAEKCHLDDGSQGECYTYTGSHQQTYSVIKLAKTGGAEHLEPIVLLAGGPGQGASKVLLPMIRQFSQLRKKRDLILVDQLGTGRSSPIPCPKLEAMTGIQQLKNPKMMIQSVKSCGTALKTSPIPIRMYGTDAYVQTLEIVRKQLGYEKLVLYGISYGTRVAVRYGMLFPSSIKSMVLEGVAGNELVLFNNAIMGRPIAIGSIETRLGDNQPPLSKQIDTVVTKLPLTTNITDPNSGKKEKIVVDRSNLWSAITLSLYDPTLTSLLPQSIKEASQGNFQALFTPGLTAQMNLNQIHLFTVACSEDYRGPESLSPKIFQEERNQLIELCSAWPKFEIAKNFRKAPQFTIPTLMLAGTADPATPLPIAENLDKSLKNSKLARFPHFGHNVFFLPCARKIMENFISNPQNVNQLDIKCTKKVKTPKFFSNGLGPI